MKKLILPNEYPPRDGRATGNQLLSLGLWRKAADQIIQSELKMEGIRKVSELRKSAGIESPPSFVKVNLPGAKQ